MEKVQLGIDLRDAEYADRIQRYINQLEEEDMLAVCYEKSVNEKAVKIWLSDGNHLESLQKRNRKIILMTDMETTEKILWTGERIDPYLSGRRLVRRLKECIERFIESESLSPYNIMIEPRYVADGDGAVLKGNGCFISVYSPIGGCGKSVFAMTLSESLAELYPEKRILYLNLEGASDWPMYYKAKGLYNLSDFLYSMLLEKPSQEKAREYIHEMAACQMNGVYFIEPCNTFDDLNVLESSEIQQLMDILQWSFDYVVCDLNTAFHSVNRQFMQRSGRRFVLMNGTVSGYSKIQNFREGVRKQQLESSILGEGVRFVRIGGQGKEKRKDIECIELPIQKELYLEKEGMLLVRHNTEWYRKVKGIAEEAGQYGRTWN